MTNTFKGPDALKDFLNPGKHPNLPMVELPCSLNPFAAEGVRIFAKMMGLSPLGNVKAVPAFNMVREMYRRGELSGVERLVENSSGNTVFSMALAARQFGVPRTQSYVPSEISWNKLLMLQFFGIEPIVNVEPQAPEENDPRTGVFKARQDGQQPGAMNPGQYENNDNPEAHENGPARKFGSKPRARLIFSGWGWGPPAPLSAMRVFSKAKTPISRWWA